MSDPGTSGEAKAGSLRLRFMAAILLWVVLGVGAIWYGSVRVFATHVERSYHEELEVHVRELGRLTRIDDDGQPVLARPLSDPRYEVPLSGFYWQVTTPGKKTLRSASMTRGELDEHVAHSPEITHVVENGPTGPAITYGFVKHRPDGEDVHFVIATDQAELDRLIHSFTRELTVWLVLLGALLLGTGVAIISFALRPLNRLGQAIAELRASRAEQLEGRYPREIAPLVSDLNAYVRQTRDMIARARVQAGNLAHSLRTPLAVVTDEAERLAEGSDPSQSSRVLLEQARMMEQQIEYQLARSRFAGAAHVPGASSAMPELLLPILAAMRRLHPDVDFALSTKQCDSATLPFDPVDLFELMSILLDNAGKWARAQVTVALRFDKAGAFNIEIADDGPGMAEDQIAAAFEVGTRFDPNKPGSGLGLAIAREICTAMGVRLTLTSSQEGLTAAVRFQPMPEMG
ncbi:MAG TPA: HAMP domain-containing sensor histidine kinase [Sphingobium sp.]|nr:HAMP domain-containing sensor histidine kinase [Sphingobium sp.]